MPHGHSSNQCRWSGTLNRVASSTGTGDVDLHHTVIGLLPSHRSRADETLAPRSSSRLEPGSPELEVEPIGNDQHRVINGGTSLTLRNLTLTKGYADLGSAVLAPDWVAPASVSAGVRLSIARK